MEIVAAVLLFGGSSFMLITALGLVRLPDFFLRMHAITKAGTLGVGLIFLAVAAFFGDVGTVTRALATIAFVLLTAPVSAHMIGRAGYLEDVPMAEGTTLDALHGFYDPEASDEKAADAVAAGGHAAPPERKPSSPPEEGPGGEGHPAP